MNLLDHKIRQLEREIFLDGSRKAKQELRLLKAQYEEFPTMTMTILTMTQVKNQGECWSVK